MKNKGTHGKKKRYVVHFEADKNVKMNAVVPKNKDVPYYTTSFLLRQKKKIVVKFLVFWRLK